MSDHVRYIVKELSAKLIHKVLESAMFALNLIFNLMQ